MARKTNIETNTVKIVRRLVKDGWVGREGGKHEVYKHPGKPGIRIVVPRHKTQSPGVARGIAQDAGWN